VESAALAILQQLGSFKETEKQQLAHYLDPQLRNWAGTEVGQIRVDLPAEVR
jgi:L-asparaginase II